MQILELWLQYSVKLVYLQTIVIYHTGDIIQCDVSISRFMAVNFQASF